LTNLTRGFSLAPSLNPETGGFELLRGSEPDETGDSKKAVKRLMESIQGLMESIQGKYLQIKNNISLFFKYLYVFYGLTRKLRSNMLDVESSVPNPQPKGGRDG